MATKTRGAPSGPLDSEKTTLSIAGAASVNTNSVTLITAALTGARTTDVVSVSPVAALTAGLSLGSAYVATAGVVTIPVINATAAQVALGNITLFALVHKFST